MSTFGDKLKQIRIERDISQDELAKILSSSKQVISRYETNQRTPKISTVQKWSEKLGVSLNYLADDSSSIVTPAPKYDTQPFIKNILPLPKTKLIPLLGTIACGEPIIAEENTETYFPADDNLKSDFCLRCKGDSMINAHIFDGDIVYIRKQPDVEDGQIAAVLIGEEATLKKVRKINNKLVLSPCNPLYDDMVFQGEELNDIKILGKAIAYTGIIK